MKPITDFIILLLVMFCNALINSEVDDLPIVDTNLGRIQGRNLRSRLDNSFLAFRGIRYAEAPVNDLRFQPPIPVKPWNGTFDATEDGPICVQFIEQTPNDISEDCLRLNVYTRNLNPQRKRAVLIYFHPGGYYGLSGQSKTVAGPEYLLDHDIVLVTVNYRLGILGFLSTGTKEAPGNNGLKDQVQVMRWVQENIDKFGGDANSVTIMGYSAGSMSVTLHLMSPMSQRLFHRAIVMSGSAVSQWEIPSEQLDLAKRQARLLNCSDESVETIMSCLKIATKEDIGYSTPKMFEFDGGHPIMLFKPVVEPDFGQERFLTQDPTCAFERGQFAKVDILTGITEYEFLYPAVYILRNETLRQQMATNFDQLAPICFLYERDSEKSKRITSDLKSRFFNETDSPDWLTFNGLKDLFADGVIGFGAHRFMQLASPHTNLYHYKFSYTGRYSHTLYPLDKPYGAVHHDDLLYLFRVPIMTPMFKKTDPENIIVESVTGWWTNFAQTGNPNEGEYASQVVWEKSTPNDPKHLDINEMPAMKTNLFTERYNIWERLFPIENSHCE